jgi:4-hydroxybenzoyl-CoA thioesterase
LPYVQRLGVRFDDVDFAQIVYYPRLFGYCHWVFEDFFAKEVGVPYAKMLTERKVGFPTVHADADFKSPLRFGDTCRVELETLGVGERSIQSRYRLFLNESDTLCARLDVVTVSIQMGTFQPVNVPDDVRAAFLRHRAA